MGKRILIGSMLVLVLLLLMPSIPAIQQKTIEDKAHSDFVEKSDDLDLNELKKLNGIKYPILCLLFFYIIQFRYDRGMALQFFAFFWDYDAGVSELRRPIMYVRGIWLEETAYLISEIVKILSIYYGWGWENPQS